VATEAAWLSGKSLRTKKNVEKSKKLLTGVGLLMEGVDRQHSGFVFRSGEIARNRSMDRHAASLTRKLVQTVL
jgi:hypothetical protein